MMCENGCFATKSTFYCGSCKRHLCKNHAVAEVDPIICKTCWEAPMPSCIHDEQETEVKQALTFALNKQNRKVAEQKKTIGHLHDVIEVLLKMTHESN